MEQWSVSASSRQGSMAGPTQIADSPFDEAASESELGRNAISTLLQPPIVHRTLQPHAYSSELSWYKPPTARDIPPVALTNIQTVESTKFIAYISQVGSIYKDLQRLRDVEGEPRDGQGRKASYISEVRQDSLYPGMQSKLRRKGSTVSIASISSQNQSLPRRRDSLSGSRKTLLSSLSTIPAVYASEDFHLENPRTFDLVSERSDVVPSNPTVSAEGGNVPPPRKALATNAILQEKLSWYMDTVEAHLVTSISRASTAFFSTLDSLRELHSKAAESAHAIHKLRQDLLSVNEDVVKGGLQLLSKRQEKRNLQQLRDAVLQLKRIVEGVSQCESLVDDGEMEKALAKIDTVELLMCGKHEQDSCDGASTETRLPDMHRTAALRGVESDLAILRSRISTVYESQIHSHLIADLQHHIQSVSMPDILTRWESASLPRRRSQIREPSASSAYMIMGQELRTALKRDISGLHRSKSISTAINAYRGLVLQEVQKVIRRPLPSSTDDNDSIMSGSSRGDRGLTRQEKSSILARNIRDLNADDAETLLATIYVSVAETLRRLKTQSSLLLDAASANADTETDQQLKPSVLRSPLSSPKPTGNAPVFEIQEEIYAALGLPSLLAQAVDLSHEKISRILRVRSQQVTALPLAHFLRYFTLNLFFANECEAISGRPAVALQTVINDQIKNFIVAHRDREMQTLATGMSADDWQDKDFTAQDNEILKQVLECSTSDPSAWAETSKIWAPLPLNETEEGESADLSRTKRPPKDKAAGAIIEEESFVLPCSAMLCLVGLSNFLRLISSIPSMAPDITMSLISYLKTFDSRCRQLILGAGAMRSAGLKHITMKHLALASQAVSFIATIITYTREFVRRVAPANCADANFMGEFDRVRRTFQEHQDSIYQKMVEIMESRAYTLSRKIREIEWDNEAAENEHRYMTDLATDTSKLYKTLIKYLPEQVVESVMASVLKSYKQCLGGAFKETELKTEIGRSWMIRDIELFTTKLSKIKGCADMETHLLDIVKEKKFISVQAGDSSREPENAGNEKEDENEESEAAT